MKSPYIYGYFIKFVYQVQGCHYNVSIGSGKSLEPNKCIAITCADDDAIHRGMNIFNKTRRFKSKPWNAIFVWRRNNEQKRNLWVADILWPLLLACIDFNPNMDK